MNDETITVSERGANRIRSGHVWVYRSDLIKPEGIAPGAAVGVLDRKRRWLGRALFSTKSQIALRILTQGRDAIDKNFLASRLRAAAKYRTQIVQESDAYRLVSSEGDFLPSLIVDRYGDVLVVQTNSQGMERLKPLLVEILQELFSPRAIVERNEASVRALEGMEGAKGVLSGEIEGEVIVKMNSIRFAFDPLKGQKTGGFLDQRENYLAARPYASGRALDCFSYAGGFALSMASRCDSVLAVESSSEALAWARRNQTLNSVANVEWKEGNCFDYLRAADHAKELFDTIVLDPPPFARQRASLDSALRGYKELNLRALKMLRPGGFLITCSCSFHVSEADFLSAVAAAAIDAHRMVTVVERRTQARDHRILLTVPETLYLKCLILRVD